MLRALLSIIVLGLLVAPQSASARCGPTTPSDVYDSPEVQVRATHTGLVACLRATGERRVVARGKDLDVEFAGVVGRRWLHTRHTTSIVPVSEQLIDLRTGQAVAVPAPPETQTIAVNGALISAEQGGIVARYTDGRTELLAPGPAAELAASDRRLYWNVNGLPQTVPLTLPAADPARAPLRARRISRCVPRPGSRLLLKARRVVVTRDGHTARVCFDGRWTTLRGATSFAALGGPDLGYTRPGFTGVLDARSGKRREVPRVRGGLIASVYMIAAPAPDGLRMWFYDRNRSLRLATKPVTEIVAGPGALYWLDASGSPRAWIHYQPFEA